VHPLRDQKGLPKKGLACTEKCIAALRAYHLVSLTLMSAKTKVNGDDNNKPNWGCSKKAICIDSTQHSTAGSKY